MSATSDAAATGLSHPLAPLAAEYLAAKAVAARAGDPGNSHRARRADLCRWARAICALTGRPVIERADGSFDLAEDLAPLTLADLDAELLLAALASLRAAYSPATAARSLATLRGLCRYLVRRGYLSVDPTDDELLAVAGVGSAYAEGTLAVRALSASEVDALRAAAADPSSAPRTSWPRRDVAVVELLAGCGLRASELCALELRSFDTDRDPPMLRVARGSKGGRRREVPLPRRVIDAVDAYLVERRSWALSDARFALEGSAPLLVRRSGAPFNQQFLDRLVRRLAADAGVSLPPDAAAHAFRHHYGVSLASRGVPVPVIQELLGHADPRTTAIYMRMAGTALVAALDDAGWLD